MQSNKTKDDTQLPKIYSQKRLHTTSDRRRTQQDTALANRPLSNNGRTRSLRAFTSKSVKYETTGNIYNKKVEDIEKQTILVDRQIKNVEDQINQLRQTIGLAKKQPGMSRMNESTASYFSKISSRKVSLADQETVKTELKNLQAKILNSRNKIDTHLQKNKAIQQQIQAYRKEISTLKNINLQLETSFKQTSSKYELQMEVSKKLDSEIAEKNQMTHRKKIDNMHQKAQMIKQYDVILRTLDKQLNNEKTTNEDQKSHFYLTDINAQLPESQPIQSHSKEKVRLLASGKKLRINDIRQKLKNYEKQFEQLKSKVGSENIEQITKKFTQEYQNNFHQYNFINQMYKEYEEANKEQFDLIQKKSELVKELSAEKSSSKVREIVEYRENIHKIHRKKDKLINNMIQYNKIALQMKVYLAQYFNSLRLPQTQKGKIIEDLSDTTVAKYLHQIAQKHSGELQSFYSEKNFKDKKLGRNQSVMGKQSVDDLIQEVKKEGQVSKDNRLLTRQQLQKNTIQLKEKKLEASTMSHLARTYKNKKQIQKARIEKKISR